MAALDEVDTFVIDRRSQMPAGYTDCDWLVATVARLPTSEPVLDEHVYICGSGGPTVCAIQDVIMWCDRQRSSVIKWSLNNLGDLTDIWDLCPRSYRRRLCWKIMAKSM